jgi:nuclear transport factor 2 (NTF2) superfamily protein
MNEETSDIVIRPYKTKGAFVSYDLIKSKITILLFLVFIFAVNNVFADNLEINTSGIGRIQYTVDSTKSSDGAFIGNNTYLPLPFTVADFSSSAINDRERAQRLVWLQLERPDPVFYNDDPVTINVTGKSLFDVHQLKVVEHQVIEGLYLLTSNGQASWWGLQSYDNRVDGYLNILTDILAASVVNNISLDVSLNQEDELRTYLNERYGIEGATLGLALSNALAEANVVTSPSREFLGVLNELFGQVSRSTTVANGTTVFGVLLDIINVYGNTLKADNEKRKVYNNLIRQLMLTLRIGEIEPVIDEIVSSQNDKALSEAWEIVKLAYIDNFTELLDISTSEIRDRLIEDNTVIIATSFASNVLVPLLSTKIAAVLSTTAVKVSAATVGKGAFVVLWSGVNTYNGLSLISDMQKSDREIVLATHLWRTADEMQNGTKDTLFAVRGYSRELDYERYYTLRYLQASLMYRNMQLKEQMLTDFSEISAWEFPLSWASSIGMNISNDGKDAILTKLQENKGLIEESLRYMIPEGKIITAISNKIVLPTPLPPTNSKPVAHISSSSTNVTVGTQVTLNGSSSYDPDGDDIDSYDWILGIPTGSNSDITSSSASTMTFTPDKAGTYRVQLTVTDENGKANSTNISVNATDITQTYFDPEAISLTGKSIGSNKCGDVVQLSSATYTLKDGEYWNEPRLWATTYDSDANSPTPQYFLIGLNSAPVANRGYSDSKCTDYGQTSDRGFDGDDFLMDMSDGTYTNSGRVTHGKTWNKTITPGTTVYFAMGVADDYPFTIEQMTLETNVLLDQDGDGVSDDNDFDDNDPLEWDDSDSDGTGDNADQFDNDPSAWQDSDGDGCPNTINGTSTTGLLLDQFINNSNLCIDDDLDSIDDRADDLFPNNSNEWADADLDGVGDNADQFDNDVAASLDSDQDGYPDAWNLGKSGADSTSGLILDQFPNDPNEWEDSDFDGVGNNSDWAPNDYLEWADSDGDNIGDNADAAPNDQNRSLNQAPIISLEAESAEILTTDTLSLSINTSDPDNDLLSLSLHSDLSFVAIIDDSLSIYPTDSDAGNYTIIVGVKDDFGGSTFKSLSLLISKDPNSNQRPTIEITSPENNAVIENVETSIQFTGTANDDDGSIQAVNYRLDDGEWQTAVGNENWSFTLSALTVGNHSVDVRAIDDLSLPGESVQISFVREAEQDNNQKPTVDITSPADNSIFENTQTEVVFNGTASDPDGTVSKVEYRFNDGQWLTATGTDNWNFTLTELAVGQHTIDVHAVDNLDLPGTDTRYTITRKADSETLLPEIVVNGGVLFELENETSVFSVSGQASYRNGEIALVEYRYNDLGWQLATGTSDWSISVDNLKVGDNNLTIRAQETKGLKSLDTQVIITRKASVNNQIPELAITSPESSIDVDYSISQYSISGNASDLDGTIEKLEFTLGNGIWQPIQNESNWSFVVDLDYGLNNISVRAQDNSGAYSLVSSLVITREHEPVAPLPYFILETDTNMIVDNAIEQVAIIGSVWVDPRLTVSYVEYRINSGEWIPAPGGQQFTIVISNLALGETEIELRALDSASNANLPMQDDKVIITRLAEGANEAPSIAITSPTQTIYQGTLSPDNLIITGTANDTDGSIAGVYYRVNSSEWTLLPGLESWQLQVTQLVEGDNLFEFKAIDNALLESNAPYASVNVVAVSGAQGTILTLNDGDSYDFSTGVNYQYRSQNSGRGDFNFYSDSIFNPTAVYFYANDLGQRGLIELGVLSDKTPSNIVLPIGGYQTQGISVIEGHSYFSLAQEGEEGNVIFFTVLHLSDYSVTIDYQYLPESSFIIQEAKLITNYAVEDAILQACIENVTDEFTYIHEVTELTCLDYPDIASLSGLEHFTALEKLQLLNTNITDFAPISQLNTLHTLVITGGNVSDLSEITSLNNLSHLVLQQLEISDVSALAEMTNLKLLTLSGNNIVDITALEKLTKLTNLYLSDNQISDISPLKNLSLLQEFDLRFNQGITCVDVSEYFHSIDELPESCLISSTLDTDLDGIPDIDDIFPNDSSMYLTLKTSGDGTGVIEIPDSGVSCEQECTIQLILGTEYSVNVIPDYGSAVLGWDGSENLICINGSSPSYCNDIAISGYVTAQINFDIDTDLDGQGNSVDTDDDGDGVEDSFDAFPLDAAESVDTDLDGIGNNTDTDDDGDKYADTDEVAAGSDPLNGASLPLDTDGDFISDVTDTDDDNDGVEDTSDAFPLDATESVDTDGDGIGNNTDTDDDGDGIVDSEDEAPLDNTVGDSQAPIFGEVLEATFEATGVTTAIELFEPEVTDNNLNTPTLVSNYSEAQPLGSHEVTWTATDFAGNTATATQQVLIVDTTAPEFAEAQIQTINARGLVTNITNDIAFEAHDIVDGDIAVQIVGNAVLSSGKHVVVVSAEDASGNMVEADVNIHINPRVELTQNTKVEPGATIAIPVYLTGDAAIYPVVIDYAVTGVDLQTNNHQLIIEADEKGSLPIVIPSAAVNGEVVKVALTSAVNAVLGNVRDIELLVVAENYSPTLQVTLEQNNKLITIVDAQGGVVTVTATINDMNTQDSHDISWSANDDALVDIGTDSLSTTFEFSPQSLESNTYGLSVQVKENNTSELYEISVATDVVVDAALATLSDEDDSDNDGTPDAEEGYADSDQDGIADYLDNDDNPSHLPIGNDSAPMQTINGLTLSLGDVVSSANGVSAQDAAVDINDITENGGENGSEVDNSLDAHFETVSTIINFNLSGLTEVGITVPVVIPLADGDVISSNSIYRKYNATQGWYNFVEDDDNAILSALTDSDGNCPVPLSNEYSPGLNVGDNCIELLIKDGGENDADGLANGMIKDPGALATETPNQAPVINLVNAIEVNEITDVVLDASATTDAENDTLTYQWTQLSGSEVSLSGTDTALLSFSAPSVSDDELLTFELVVNDGRDSVTATVEVLVLQVNALPTVLIDSHASSFNEGASISLSAQGADEDNDALTYLWEQVSGPNITLSDNTLANISFTAPEVAGNQTVEIKVTVLDGTDSVSATTSFVVNNVVAPVTPPKESSDGGGGSMAWLLILLGLASLRGKEYRR